jgi:hypothetical protein
LIEVAGLCRRTLVVVDLLGRAMSQTLNKLENSFYGWRYERFPACRGFDLEVSSGRGSKPAVCRANWTLVVVDVLARAISHTLNKLEKSFYGWRYERFPACRGFDVEVSSGSRSKPAVCRANWTLVVVDLLGWAISHTWNKLENSFYGWSMTGFAV